jgi:RimJ/RimL family protein N-acetyltransferase
MDQEFMGLSKIVMTTDDECEIDDSLIPAYWGQGYGFEIARQLISHIKSHDSIKSIKAMVDMDNIASQKILLKNGMTCSHQEMHKGVDVKIIYPYFVLTGHNKFSKFNQ